MIIINLEKCFITVPLHFLFQAFHSSIFMTISFFFNKKAVLFLLFTAYMHIVFAQQKDSTKQVLNLFTAVSITNNGISVIPSFSLGKPAAIIDLDLRYKKFSCEPQFRLGLNGKPWSFIFWWRYKLLKTPKFSLNVGAHPSVLFKTTPDAVVNGVTKDLISAQRYLAAEVVPTYSLTPNISVGAYYLYSHGLQKDGIQNTNFLTLNATFSNISLGKNLFLRISPQVFYLKMDKNDGFYANAAVTISKKNAPLSFTLFGNQKIKSSIAGQDFVWNATLMYGINRKFVSQ